MEKDLNRESNLSNESTTKNEEVEFYEVPGAARAMTSGSIHMMIALLSSTCIWIFTIIVSGNEGLTYYGTTSFLLGLLGVLGNGFSQAYIAKIKEAYVIDPEVGKRKATGFSKIIWILGLISSMASFLLFIFTPPENIYLKVAAFACIFQTLFGFMQVTLGNGLAIVNRYDLIAFSGATWGPTLLVWGFIWITFDWPPEVFAFYLILANLISITVGYYFFHKHCPYSLMDIIKGDFFSRKVINSVEPELKQYFEHNYVLKYIGYSAFSTVTNLEGIGVFWNLLAFFATLYLFYISPGIQGIAIEIITIVGIYASVRTVILFFSGPLNVELSEAVTKGNHDMVDEIFNNTTRVASLLGLGFCAGMCAIARHLLQFLHAATFQSNSGFNEELLLQGQVLMILTIIGQFAFGFAVLFGNALVGSGNAKYSGIAFSITTGILIALAPLMIYTTGFVGIGWVQVFANIFILPYMIWQIKKRLKIKIHFRFLRLLPCITIMFLFMYFFPVVDSTTFIIDIVIGGVIFLILCPFFGVSIPPDLEMLEDLFGIMKLRFLGRLFGKGLIGIYNISPFNRKDKEQFKRKS